MHTEILGHSCQGAPRRRHTEVLHQLADRPAARRAPVAKLSEASKRQPDPALAASRPGQGARFNKDRNRASCCCATC